MDTPQSWLSGQREGADEEAGGGTIAAHTRVKSGELVAAPHSRPGTGKQPLAQLPDVKLAVEGDGPPRQLHRAGSASSLGDSDATSNVSWT